MLWQEHRKEHISTETETGGCKRLNSINFVLSLDIDLQPSLLQHVLPHCTSKLIIGRSDFTSLVACARWTKERISASWLPRAQKCCKSDARDFCKQDRDHQSSRRDEDIVWSGNLHLIGEEGRGEGGRHQRIKSRVCERGREEHQIAD